MKINKVFELSDIGNDSPIIDECIEIFDILPNKAKFKILDSFPCKNSFYRLLSDITESKLFKRGWENIKEYRNDLKRTMQMIQDEGAPYQIQNCHPYIKLWEIAWTTKFSGLNKDSIVLNAGSGLSYFPDIYLATKCKQLYSIDNDKYQKCNIKIRNECYNAYNNKHNINFSERNILDTGFEDNFFDTIVSHSVVEHIPDRVAVFRELSRVIKPGGIIATASVHSFTEQLYAQPSCYISSTIDDMLRLLPDLELCGDKYHCNTGWKNNCFEKDKVDYPYPYVCNVFFLRKKL